MRNLRAIIPASRSIIERSIIDYLLSKCQYKNEMKHLNTKHALCIRETGATNRSGSLSVSRIHMVE